MRSDKGPWKDVEIMRVGLQSILFFVFSPCFSQLRTLVDNSCTMYGFESLNLLLCKCRWFRMVILNVQKKKCYKARKRKKILR